MVRPARAAGIVIGLDAYPQSTLLDRALELLTEAPADSNLLANRVLGLPSAPPAVADRLAAALLGADPRVQRRVDGRWGLVSAVLASPLIEDCAFAVVDVETTGSAAWTSDRVIEVAVVVVHGTRREVVFDRLVNPGRSLPRPVERLTRITNADLRRAPRFEEVAEELLAALAGRVFVAHNVKFDWSFVAAELRRARGLELTGPRLCTARLARKLVPVAESCGLDWLSQYFGIENEARHRAGGDAIATATLLSRLTEIARADGARTLNDLEALQRKRKHRPRAARRRAKRKES